ncbi:MAG TPA: methyltransferase domain-containing protein [Bacillota bacterium]|nr:methyltransferase domain-containing protein [Bacillota bacterium]HOL15036.1 methyltransferase domain-containing protein [Bacillota bacterium]
MINYYADKYRGEGYYWGTTPSAICYEILKLIPPVRPLKLLDIGCGEGRNAVFFARNGYIVSAFDLAPDGVEKTRQMSAEAGVTVNAFEADLLTYRFKERFDILFSVGVLHYIPPALRKEIFEHYKAGTARNGLHAFSVFVKKPFIEDPPEKEPHAHPWISGELFTYYHDWKIEFCSEDIFDCLSSGVPHRHAVNRIIARNV